MRERPILFSGEMVRAILDGRKTMTRRVVKRIPCDCGEWIPEEMSAVTPEGYQTAGHSGLWWCDCCMSDFIACPYGQPGDRLWVRETFAYATDFGYSTDHIFYKASYLNGGPFDDVRKWKPSIFMRRSESRITIEVVSVKAKRLQDISAMDAIAEGIDRSNAFDPHDRAVEEVTMFRELWTSINHKTHPWTSNPWVWVIEFRRIK